ncbi:MAG: hypothetical protein FWD17_01340 [Polyangiaceae bacterium]|nr:hypothetical protein [Polyangiaceae bacterium]
MNPLHPSRLRRVPWRAARIVFGTVRVAVYAAVVATVIAVLAFRAVRVQAAERALSLGRELVPFKDLLHGTQRISLNGESMFIASAVTDERMGEVLDRWETECASQSGGLAEQFDALPPAAKTELASKAPAAWQNRLGIWREERDTEGSIVCLERRPGHGLRDAIAAMATFAKSGDVGAIGNFRYVYVRATDAGRTHVLTSFTEGSFNVWNVVGRGGREPAGNDPPETPRPPMSSRKLSAEVNRMYGTYVFTSASPPEEVLEFYETELPGKGWQYLMGPSKVSAQVWQRQGVTMVVGATRGEGEGVTHVSFAQGRTIEAEASR